MFQTQEARDGNKKKKFVYLKAKRYVMQYFFFVCFSALLSLFATD